MRKPPFLSKPTSSSSGICVAIDASRNRSGGARAHLLGLLGAGDPRQHGVAVVHVWSYSNLLREVPESPWLVKHSPPELERSLLRQLWWQRFALPREAAMAGCDVMLSTDAGTVCRFYPAVVMSRDMLSFEHGEMSRYAFCSFSRLRLLLLKYMQISSLRSAAGALFLTKYASCVIQNFTGNLKDVFVIPHGIGEQFRITEARVCNFESLTRINCVYVSNADLYKHQWSVIEAIADLRILGFPVFLELVGGGAGPAKALVDKAIRKWDPYAQFVRLVDAVPHSAIPTYLAKADIFIFASSCENLPNTLIEAMASGLPIACSDRGPMPEVLQDGGIYFDPENPRSIAKAVEKLVIDATCRQAISDRAKSLSMAYSWGRCASETWKFLRKVCSQCTFSKNIL